MLDLSMRSVESKVGQVLGTSDWVVIDQSRIAAFADCTGDRQWIHTDVDRATREGPFGGPIAHGMLTLSMVPTLFDLPAAAHDAGAMLNYGFDTVRFLSPVRSGSRIRGTVALGDVTPKAGGRLQLKLDYVVEIEGEAKPALSASLIVLLLPKLARYDAARAA
jgi:acyl dehydratase